MERAILRALAKAIKRELGSMGGTGLPRAGLLFYSRRPNSEGQAWDDDDAWVEDAEWGSWMLPSSLFAQIGESIFFEADGTPLDVTGTAVAASDIVNVDYILFSERRGLAVYDDETAAEVMAEAFEYFGVAVPYFYLSFPYTLPFEVA